MSRSLCIALSAFGLIASLGVALPARAALDTYEVDAGHSDVGFKVRHLVAKVAGGFKVFSGEIKLDPADLSKGSVKFDIDAASIDTDVADRDAHLKGPDFFDVEKFPKITFQSTKIVAKSPTDLVVTGNLTMHGVTKPVDLNVAFGGLMADPWGNDKAGFEVTGKIDRKEFGVVWNKTLDQGGTVLGDDVHLAINIEATKVKAPAEKK
ncbi:MAG: YceI family protein [bacterium]